MSALPLILASASPRRLQLLAQIGIVPTEVLPADIDETPIKAEPPLQYVERVSRSKAIEIAKKRPQGLILSADTVVAVGRRILPKAETAQDIRDCLELMSGRRHRVHTAVTLQLPDGTQRFRLVSTIVGVKRISSTEMTAYIDSGEGIGAAGGYKIQGSFAALTDLISGSYSSVVGLPLFETAQLLKSCDLLPS